MTSTQISTIHYHVGHNMPGYLPESDIHTYLTFEDAKHAQIDDMEYVADAMSTWVDEHDCDDIPCPTYGDSCPFNQACEVSAAEQDLNLDNGPEWGTIAGGLSWWINSCAEQECELDED